MIGYLGPVEKYISEKLSKKAKNQLFNAIWVFWPFSEGICCNSGKRISAIIKHPSTLTVTPDVSTPTYMLVYKPL